MKSILAQSLIAAKGSLFSPSAPEADRQEILKAFFTPAGKSRVHLDPRELNQERKRTHFHELRGWIRVTPPGGACLIIRKKTHIEDIRVCKPKNISFSLKDIEPDGRILWDIKTGPLDFGTYMWWQTPYLVGKYVSHSMPWPGPSAAFYLSSCSLRHEGEERILDLNLIPENRISIRFPRIEVPAPQPEQAIPRLYIQHRSHTSGLIKADKGKSGSQRPDPDQAVEHKNSNAIRSDWQLHPRGSYRLEGRRVLTGQTGGGPGKCRYRYSGYEYHPEFAAIECHRIGDYKWLYLPLPCLKEKATDRGPPGIGPGQLR